MQALWHSMCSLVVFSPDLQPVKYGRESSCHKPTMTYNRPQHKEDKATQRKTETTTTPLYINYILILLMKIIMKIFTTHKNGTFMKNCICNFCCLVYCVLQALQFDSFQNIVFQDLKIVVHNISFEHQC